LKTRPVTREELNNFIARRSRRDEVRDTDPPSIITGSDAQATVLQALCRGLGIDLTSLSPQAQAMLPLVAGQLLREAVVGLTDILQSRTPASEAPRQTTATAAAAGNPIRSANSVDGAMQRLFEAHGKRIGGPVDSLREVLNDLKDHEDAAQLAMRAGVEAILDRLSPSGVADQFESTRTTRANAQAADPRTRYWEHYSEFHRLLMQTRGESVPPVFGEAYARAYEARRAELAAKRKKS
jgi:type VI secretion system FHA domain protein